MPLCQNNQQMFKKPRENKKLNNFLVSSYIKCDDNNKERCRKFQKLSYYLDGSFYSFFYAEAVL